MSVRRLTSEYNLLKLNLKHHYIINEAKYCVSSLLKYFNFRNIKENMKIIIKKKKKQNVAYASKFPQRKEIKRKMK
ncbi:hypothetical protein DOY81_006642 [Sarcophaga bullata]|nr:hypothetical protein DOY81_006642 [Sarcophaga bullata]